MPVTSLATVRWWMAVLALATLTLGTGLGRAGRLTYHEAFVAQAAREMIASGDILTPTLGGRPWLEKPPLAVWLAALTGRVAGDLTESAARAPSALAGALLALGIATFAARRYGKGTGLLAGLVQTTTAWVVMRGRLAEVDMTLACLVTWALVSFDGLRSRFTAAVTETSSETPERPPWPFFALVGLTCLAKGIGFGAALALTVVSTVLIWDRDRVALLRLKSGRGWALAGVLGLTWPLLVALRHPSALGLWFLHVADRLAAQPRYFASQTWWVYGANLLLLLLPWTPLALVGAWRSLGPACSRAGRGGGDRLLLAWTFAPLALLSLATVKNAHYAIHVLPPCSVWVALGLIRLGERLQSARGWSAGQVRAAAWTLFVLLGGTCALGFAVLGPRFDRRGVEWAFYEEAGRHLRPGEPVALMYHFPDWDRAPYDTPFGPVPHDWAIRLFYLRRPAPCRFGIDELAADPVASPSSPFAVIGREVDADGLRRFGRVETLATGPDQRSDRAYRLYRVTPDTVAAGPSDAARR